MPKKEVQIETLQNYLPVSCFDTIAGYLRQYKVHLTISKKRRSILGDYRHRTDYKSHRISVNGNLNAYSFLITLLHELAHLLTFEQFNNKVQPHGPEWKLTYSKLLEYFLAIKIFHYDKVPAAMKQNRSNPCPVCCLEQHGFLLHSFPRRISPSNL